MSALATMKVSVSDVSVNEISVGSVELSREPLHVDENSSNWQTMKQFFDGSIAAVRQVEPNHYRTAVGTKVRFSGKTEPKAFAPLTEWRINGGAIFLGEVGEYTLKLNPGLLEISSGPPENASQVKLETYSVSITSDKEVIREGQPVTFVATTNPG